MSLECTSELISANHRNRHDAGIFKGDEIELSFIKGRNDPEYIIDPLGVDVDSDDLCTLANNNFWFGKHITYIELCLTGSIICFLEARNTSTAGMKAAESRSLVKSPLWTCGSLWSEMMSPPRQKQLSVSPHLHNMRQAVSYEHTMIALFYAGKVASPTCSVYRRR